MGDSLLKARVVGDTIHVSIHRNRLLTFADPARFQLNDDELKFVPRPASYVNVFVLVASWIAGLIVAVCWPQLHGLIVLLVVAFASLLAIVDLAVAIWEAKQGPWLILDCDSPGLSDSGGGRIVIPRGYPNHERTKVRKVPAGTAVF